MGFLERLFQRDPPAQPNPPRTAARRFEAAAINRLTASWRGSIEAIDHDLKHDLDRLRARSRDLAKNNDYMRKFLRMVARNVVGPHGFVLQARAMNTPSQPDTAANAAIERAWHTWTRRGVAEITGRMTFADLCRTVVSAVARDGESLVRIVRGTDARNPHNIALQVLDAARLDTAKNSAPARAGQNAVVMGVEIDAYQRPVAYWLRPLSHVGPSERVPASDLLHLYVVEQPEQTRGVPWAHAALLRLHMLKGYEDAAVVAARVGAAKMGFFTSPDGDPAQVGAENVDGQFYAAAEAGEFGVLPAGYDFKSFDPDYPHNQYGEFVKSCLRGVASGMDVAYNGLANDLEGVSYSSIRAGVLEERDQWMTLQAWFEAALLEPVYSAWFDAAMLAGQILGPSGAPLPITKRDKFYPHAWQGRRWGWVDPLKDIEASRLAVQSGITSPQDVAAQQGKDIEDVLDDIAVFQAMAARKGVTIVSYESGAAPSSPPDDENDSPAETV
jgi:lambda family phage portal protein